MPSPERSLKDRDHPRLAMVSCQLRPHGIGEARLIQAFKLVPRETFVPPAVQSLAYADAHLPLTQGAIPQRWLLAPVVLGKLIQSANIQPTDRVLMIGCGSGYSLALVAQLASCVIGVESHEGLAISAQNYIAEQEVSNSQVVVGALSVGYPKSAPYDVILVEGAVDKIPPILMQQLSPEGGRLVTIIKKNNEFGQTEFGAGTVISRIGNTLEEVVKFDASCPYLPEFEPREEFRL